MYRQIDDQILIACDDSLAASTMRDYLAARGYSVQCVTDENELLQVFSTSTPFLLLLDLDFEIGRGLDLYGQIVEQGVQISAVVLASPGQIELAVRAIKMGADDFLSKPPDLAKLEKLVKRATDARLLERSVYQAASSEKVKGAARQMLGQSPALDRLRGMISEVAFTEATVLIYGESGTGKELVANEIHRQSRRSKQSFVPVNVAALPTNLVESALFGHVKGAFTGADKAQKGYCEMADGGTLFLDEIGEMAIDLQPKLLRFLQESTVQRVGSERIHKVDVRVIAATNRDPMELVRAGLLREDLYFRLNVVPMSVPPLRHRQGDVRLLSTWFARKSARKINKSVVGFTDTATEILESHQWPGNVRELENLVERLVIFSRGVEITATEVSRELNGNLRTAVAETGELPFVARMGKSSSVSHVSQFNGSVHDSETQFELTTIEQVERKAIIDALSEVGGNVVQASKILGLGQATVYRKIKRYQIQRRRSPVALDHRPGS